MDSLVEFSPAKKRCITGDIDRKQLRQCVREFELRRQFPSTIKQTVQGDVARITSILANAKNVESNAENQLHKLQKLRILSLAGKDLGEFNVKLQTNNPLKGKAITITKSNNCAPIKEPGNISSFTVTCTPKKIFPRILKQSIVKIPKNNLIDAASSKDITETDEVSRQQCTMTLSTDGISTNNQDDKANRQKKIYNYDIIEKEPIFTSKINSEYFINHVINKNKLKIYNKINRIDDLNNEEITCEENKPEEKLISSDKINSEHSTHLTVNTNRDKIKAYRKNYNVDTYKKLDSPEITTIEDNKFSSDMEVAPYVEINKSPVQIINLKKLVNTNSSSSNNIELCGKRFKVGKGKCIATIKNTENGMIVTSLKNAINFEQNYKQIGRNLNQSVLDNNKESLDDRGILDDKSSSVQVKSDLISKVHKKKTLNDMTIIPNNEILKRSTVFTQDCNIALSSRDNLNIDNVDNKVTQDKRYDDMQDKSVFEKGSEDDCRNIPKPQPITNVTDASTQQNVQNKDCAEDCQKDLSDRWSIIRKAMDSIKDNELREQALKALEDCGIGIKRYVPICPPEERKAVHDTQVQTMIFSLLDPESFVLINKDLSTICRMNEVILCDMLNNSNVSSVNNLQSNDITFKASATVEEESDFDIDTLVKQVLENNLDTSVDVSKMKETLSAMKVRCRNLVEHLQKDFENVKRYDQNGMLNIHNAVLDNNIHLVRRQLMVLQQCKESVDILTENGMTSLELAIKYDIHDEIIKLLLEAGAQPVSSRCIHDSALIIASRQSSLSLPMLVDRISDPKLLDEMDSDGLAALHHCSIRGNMQGVKALVSAGATIDLRDMKSGRTPLFHAMDNMHTSVTQALMKAGAIMNIANYAGQTPLPVVTEMKS